jgi:hypothetical protein
MAINACCPETPINDIAFLMEAVANADFIPTTAEWLIRRHARQV